VPKTGFEPAHPLRLYHLKVACLPISPPGQWVYKCSEITVIDKIQSLLSLNKLIPCTCILFYNSIFLNINMAESLHQFDRLVGIMNDLREKCPWDKKQTIESLKSMTIEETYELADSIQEKDWRGIKEELGDMLLHIVFYAKIGEEQNAFSIDEVITGICEKLIRRHPHIYGDVSVNNDDDVKRNWEKIKLQEGKKSVLEGVPNSLPSLVKAMRLQEKAKQVGFEWDNIDQVWEKVEEEIGELKEAISIDKTINNAQSKDQIEEEFGDMLFSMVNYARFLQIDPDTALERTNKKFISRFKKMENLAATKDKLLQDLSLSEMDQLWNEIKTLEK
jgi:MazG family protein